MAWQKRHVGAAIVAVTTAALVQAAGCAVAGGGGDDDGSSSQATSGGQGGSGGGVVYPCGIDCATIAGVEGCKIGTCNMDTLNCEIVNASEGTACEDGLFCTVNDTCVGGACIGGPPNFCDLVPSGCETVACNEAAQTCQYENLEEGAPCTATNLCMVNAQCQNGLCIGQEKNCFFAPVPDDCSVSECDPTTGMCEPVVGNEGEACEDSADLCTIFKVCNAGNCEGGVPKSCSHLTTGCTLGVCDTSDGNCTTQQLAVNDACDDLNPCTVGETCDGTDCTGGTLITACSAGDNCCPAGCDGMDSDCNLDILLLGDDVPAADWDSYRTALTVSGATWDEHNLDVNTVFPDLATLQGYNTVIYFDQSSSSVSDANIQVFADWLVLGQRNLFVTGYDLMWDFQGAAAGTGEKNFYDLWGAIYQGDSAGQGVATIDGVANDPISGDFVNPAGLILSMNIYSSGDYVNGSTGTAIHAAVFGSGGTGSTFSALTHYNSGNHKVVWLGVNFHNGLTNQTQKNTLMTNVLNYFKN